MTPHYIDPLVTLYLGDCLDVMRELPDASVDSVVTDPPYGLEFMGKSWDRLDNGYNAQRWEGRRTAAAAPERDPNSPGGRHGASVSPARPNPRCGNCGHYQFSSSPCTCEAPVWVARANEQSKRMQAWHEQWATEAFRVLKPGGYLLAFGGTRTYHRLASAIEDAGFEIRDTLMWIYACLSDDTEILTNQGWVRYNRASEASHAAAFDPAAGKLRWEPIEAVHVYDHTGYMVEVGPSLVTGNHRVVLSPESEVPLPSDAELRRLWERVPDVGSVPSNTSQDVFDRVPVGAAAGTQSQEAARAAQGPDGGVRDVRRGVLATYGVATSVEGSLLLQPMQREAENPRPEVPSGPRVDRGTEGEGVSRDEGSAELGLEGRRYRVQEARELLWRALRPSARVGEADGPEGRVHHGTPATDGGPVRVPDDPNRSGEPREPRPDRQPPRELDALAGQPDPQALRVGQGDRGDGLPTGDTPRLVDYAGVVWCVTVPSGAFVARRRGLAFVTGNSGFPKSLDVSKALDKVAGAEREVIGSKGLHKFNTTRADKNHGKYGKDHRTFEQADALTAPATDLARKWEGWGTALKPAHEPIVMARKPLVGTVAANVTRYGTGALNIDGTRIPSEPPQRAMSDPAKRTGGVDMTTWAHLSAEEMQKRQNAAYDRQEQMGRWPSNVLLSDPELFDEPNPWVVGSGATTTVPGTYERRDGNVDYDATSYKAGLPIQQGFGDSGGYSRFFLIPKADRAERERGLAGAPKRQTAGDFPAMVCSECGSRFVIKGKTTCGHNTEVREAGQARANSHPTVKPIDLMRHLVRLVTPPGGVTLDPFAGSGTTGLAASEEGFRAILIEREDEYARIIVGRLMATPMGLGLDAPMVQKGRKLPKNPGKEPVRFAPEGKSGESAWFNHSDDEEPAA